MSLHEPMPQEPDEEPPYARPECYRVGDAAHARGCAEGQREAIAMGLGGGEDSDPGPPSAPWGEEDLSW